MRTEERDRVRQQVLEAVRPAAQIWPLKTFAYRNPVRGYEDLPFDQGVRAAAGMIGGAGFLSGSEYRDLRSAGRIEDKHLRQALARLGPEIPEGPVRTGGRTVNSDEVVWLHLTQGIEPPHPSVLARQASEDGKTELLAAASEACPEFGSSGNGRVPDLPSTSTISDWVASLAGSPVVDSINAEMIKWSAAFLDEGMAGWGMPSREKGFYQSWRELARRDLSGRFLGIPDFAAKVGALPERAEEWVREGLERLGVPPERWSEYQSRMFAQLPGWSGFARWRSENPQYPAQHEYPIDLVDYLAVRLFYEVELVAAACQKNLGVPSTLADIRAWAREHASHAGETRARDLAIGRLYKLAVSLGLTPEQVRELAGDGARTLLGWLDAFPEDRHGPVWLAAYEDTYADHLMGKLSGHRREERAPRPRPDAQLIFCIDARSEPFRRHVEASGAYETFGYAGFFGVPFSHQAFDSPDRLALCPVLLTPPRAVDEDPRPGEEKALARYASGTRWRRLGDELFHDLKQHPLGSFVLVDVLGLLFSIALIGKTLLQRPYAAIRSWIGSQFRTELETSFALDPAEVESVGPGGFTIEERAGFVGGGLRMIGLTDPISRLVIVCGHGSESDNNPYAAAYNCGACGGAHGDPNARVFATMANDPAVRRAVAESGLDIPEDVWFVAGKHETATDRVSFYDLGDVPSTHREELKRLERDLAAAGAVQVRERIAKLPGAPRGLSPRRALLHAVGRSVDWANPRPEWGLSGNAAFLIGRRWLTKGLNLESRVFLHSYDPASDPGGGILERIMTAPLIVGEWINMEYYFSSVDPWVYGSGSKVIHNVVGGVGVMLGSQGDLQGGLPLQGVIDGSRRYHEPMRLLAIIDAPAERISGIIAKHEILQALFHNQWVNLLAFDADRSEFRKYRADSTWDRLTLEAAK